MGSGRQPTGALQPEEEFLRGLSGCQDDGLVEGQRKTNTQAEKTHENKDKKADARREEVQAQAQQW